MLPSRYRGQYTFFIAFSLLVHLVILILFLLVLMNEQPKTKQDKIVTITLTQDKEEEPKEEEPKKEESKKEESKKEESKKEEPKKEEPKEEAKKEESKKEEPKKEEPKKEEPKKQEAKKQEAKKQEAKKQEAKKQEAKKQEAKKQEAKKQEAKKQEAKEQEAKKQEAKEQEAKKQEAKKQEAKKQEAKQSESYPVPMIRDSLSEYAAEIPKDPQPSMSMPRLGSMEMLDERSMSHLVVTAQNLERKFETRNMEGEYLKEELNFFQKQAFDQAMQVSMKHLEKYLLPVRWDGGTYYGEINFYVDMEGNIEKIVIKRPSGSELLDKSMIQALVNAKSLPMPSDPQVRRVMHMTRKLLYYSDKDMIR